MTAKDHINKLPPKARIMCLKIILRGGHDHWLYSTQTDTAYVISCISNTAFEGRISSSYWQALIRKAEKINVQS